IAAGERLTITDDPQPRSHAIEFRINAEDPARDFLPAPGTITAFDPPSGPGIRLDAGVRAGSVISGWFDSMLAKLIVVGTDRQHALARSRRALAEFTVEGLPTLIPFHRAVVDDPVFTATEGEHFTVHTRWAETEFSGQLRPDDFTGSQEARARPSAQRRTVVVEVGGRRLEISLPGDLTPNDGSGQRDGEIKPRKRGNGRAARASGDVVTAPMPGTVVKLAVSDGDWIDAGDLI